MGGALYGGDETVGGGERRPPPTRTPSPASNAGSAILPSPPTGADLAPVGGEGFFYCRWRRRLRLRLHLRPDEIRLPACAGRKWGVIEREGKRRGSGALLEEKESGEGAEPCWERKKAEREVGHYWERKKAGRRCGILARDEDGEQARDFSEGRGRGSGTRWRGTRMGDWDTLARDGEVVRHCCEGGKRRGKWGVFSGGRAG